MAEHAYNQWKSSVIASNNLIKAKGLLKVFHFLLCKFLVSMLTKK